MNIDYRVFYERVSRFYRRSLKRVRILRKCNTALTYFYYVIYPVLLIYMMRINHPKIWRVIFVPMCSIILITMLRKWIHRARPYEKYAIGQLLEKDSTHHSMPSRHVFSAVIISMAWMTVSPLFAWISLCISAVVAYIRVVGGVHYPTDVAAAYFSAVLIGIFLL